MLDEFYTVPFTGRWLYGVWPLMNDRPFNILAPSIYPPEIKVREIFSHDTELPALIEAVRQEAEFADHATSREPAAVRLLFDVARHVRVKVAEYFETEVISRTAAPYTTWVSPYRLRDFQQKRRMAMRVVFDGENPVELARRYGEEPLDLLIWVQILLTHGPRTFVTVWGSKEINGRTMVEDHRLDQLSLVNACARWLVYSHRYYLDQIRRINLPTPF